jgi:zinc protease
MQNACVRLCAALLLVLGGAAVPLEGADAAPQLKFETYTLKNGMKVILAPDASRPVVNLQVWYKVGSKDERAGRTGFAHLFEHMMFRGSKNVGPEEHMRYVRELGGSLNAYTSFDQTVYWQTFPSHYLERILWLEADRMESLVINEENFQKEREVVKEERRLRTENPPFGLLLEKVLSEVYRTYPYKHSPIGSMEDLNNATTKDVQEFFDTYYVPNNATLVIVGDFEPKQAMGFVQKHLGRLPRGKDVPRVTAQEPPQKEFREIKTTLPNTPLPVVISAYHLPPIGHPDSYALEIASAILSAGQSSRIYRQLVYDEQVALQAAGQALLLEGPSLFFAFAIANQGKDIREASSSLQMVLETIKTEQVTADELSKAKNQISSRYILGRQSMQQKADALGRAAVLLGGPEAYNTELAKYQAVSAADVQRVCQKYLASTNETRLWLSQPEGGSK